jgi:hypothetical protein
MTEAAWLLIRHPAVLLDAVRANHTKLSTRKLRLYLCACSRCIPDFTSAERLPEAVEIIEAFADGLVNLDQLNVGRSSFVPSGHRDLRGRFWRLTRCVLSGNNQVWDAAKQVANLVAVIRVLAMLGPKTPEIATQWESLVLAERSHLCPLVRDIFGNPFHPAVSAAPTWLTSTVVGLARHIHDSRDFSAMPILADALQDAGCDNDDILNHCRDSNATHVRGCWVVDCLLGKE